MNIEVAKLEMTNILIIPFCEPYLSRWVKLIGVITKAIVYEWISKILLFHKYLTVENISIQLRSAYMQMK